MANHKKTAKPDPSALTEVIFLRTTQPIKARIERAARIEKARRGGKCAPTDLSREFLLAGLVAWEQKLANHDAASS